MKSFTDRLRAEILAKVNPNVRKAVIVTAVYAAITIIVTYPVAFKLTSAVAGFDGRDSLQYVWSLWWARKAIVDLGTSPANLTFLYHPTGAYHPLLFVTPYLELVSLPLEGVLNSIAVYNIQFLLSFILTGLTTYLLGLELTGNRYAAFIGGLIFAFFPNKMGHATAGHLTQLVTYWFPLYALFLLKLWRTPCLQNSLLCGLFLALSLLVSIIHIAYFVIPVSVVLIIYKYRRNPHGEFDVHLLRWLGVAFLVAFLLTGPFLAPLVAQKLGGQLGFLKEEGLLNYSVDLVALFSPSPYHPLFERLGISLRSIKAIIPKPTELEHTAYLGLVSLSLALVGWLKRTQESKPWLILCLLGTALSLGPFLKIGGELVSFNIEGVTSFIPLPYAFLANLPFYEWGRTPERFNTVSMFALAILSCYGAASVIDRIGSRGSKWSFLIALSALILFDFWLAFPFPVGGDEVPHFYRKIAEESGDYAILDIPIVERPIGNYAMYYQTFHHHKIVGGYIHRDPIGTEELVEAINAIVEPDVTGTVSQISQAELQQFLRGLNIEWVVAHKRLIKSSRVNRIVLLLKQQLGAPNFEDSNVAIFSVPQFEWKDKSDFHTQQARLGEAITFFGYRLEGTEFKPGDEIPLGLLWEAQGTMDTDYTVFVHLLDQEQRIWGQMDTFPLRGAWPTTRWCPGQILLDEYAITVNPDAPTGRYLLEVGMYDVWSDQRLPAFQGGEPLPGNRILLDTSVSIEEK